MNGLVPEVSQQKPAPTATGCPRGTSRATQDDVISKPRRIRDGGEDVIGFKEGIILKDLLVACPVAQQIQYVRDPNPFAPDARATATFSGFHRDSFEQIHADMVGFLAGKCNREEGLEELELAGRREGAGETVAEGVKEPADGGDSVHGNT
jgi:hypothetical protein